MAGTDWNVFQPNTKAKSSEVNENFDWLEGSLWPMSNGLTTTGVYDIGSDAYKWRNGYFSNIINTPNIGLSDTAYLNISTGGTVTANVSLKLNTGTAINEFSTDGTMAGDSDLAVPTEKAVKTYVTSYVSAFESLPLRFISQAISVSPTQGSYSTMSAYDIRYNSGEFDTATSTFTPNTTAIYEIQHLFELVWNSSSSNGSRIIFYQGLEVDSSTSGAMYADHQYLFRQDLHPSSSQRDTKFFNFIGTLAAGVPIMMGAFRESSEGSGEVSAIVTKSYSIRQITF